MRRKDEKEKSIDQKISAASHTTSTYLFVQTLDELGICVKNSRVSNMELEWKAELTMRHFLNIDAYPTHIMLEPQQIQELHFDAEQHTRMHLAPHPATFTNVPTTLHEISKRLLLNNTLLLLISSHAPITISEIRGSHRFQELFVVRNH